jgi:hypothetical protein
MPEKQEDILDQVKKAEKTIKLGLLMKRIGDLKDIAKEIMEAKEESTMILEEIGIKDEDIKRIIDFVTSSVSLSDEDKKEIRARVKKENEQSREKVEEQVQKNYTYTNVATTTAGASGTSVVGWGGNVYATDGSTLTYTSGKNSLDIKI